MLPYTKSKNRTLYYLTLGAALSFVVYVFGLNACLAQLSKTYHDVLNLPFGDRHTVFTWLLLTVLADIALYRWILWRPPKKASGDTKSYAARNISFLLHLLCRLAYLALCCLPLLCEANTDSSLTMFVLNYDSVAIVIYSLVLALMAFWGSAVLIIYRNHFSYKDVDASCLLHIQVACLMVSDIPMFIMVVAGLPCGILTNTCVNLFAVGVGIVYYSKYPAWVNSRFEALDTLSLGSYWLRPKDAPKKHMAKTHIFSQVFGFLAISRVVNWSLACVFGPTSWLESINPLFGAVVLVILVMLWFGSALRLWYTVQVYKKTQLIIIPFEPVLVYMTTVHDYVRLIGLQFKLKKRSAYRFYLRWATRFLSLNLRLGRGRVVHTIIKLACQRVSIWHALIRLPFAALPHYSCLTSGLLNSHQQLLALQNLRGVNTHINMAIKHDLGKVLMPALISLITLVGAGSAGILYTDQVSNGANMAATAPEAIDYLTGIDADQLSDNKQKAHSLLLDHEKNKLVRGEQICKGTIFDLLRNQDLISEHIAEKARTEMEARLLLGVKMKQKVIGPIYHLLLENQTK